MAESRDAWARAGRQLSFLVDRSGPVRDVFSRGVVAAVLVTVCRLLLPWPLHAVLAPFLGHGGWDLPFTLPQMEHPAMVGGVLFAALMVGLGLADAWERTSFARFSIGLVADLRRDAVAAIESGQVTGASTRTGEIIARLVGDAGRLKGGLKGFLVHVATNAVLLVGTALVLVFLDPLLGALFGSAVLVIFGVTVVGAGSVYQVAHRYRRNEGRLARALVKLARANRQQAPVEKMKRRTAKVFQKVNRTSGSGEARVTQLTTRTTAIAHSLFGAYVLAAVVLGTARLEAGIVTEGELLLFVLYVAGARQAVVQLSRQGARAGKILACVERLVPLVSTRDAPPPDSPPVLPEPAAVPQLQQVES